MRIDANLREIAESGTVAVVGGAASAIVLDWDMVHVPLAGWVASLQAGSQYMISHISVT